LFWRRAQNNSEIFHYETKDRRSSLRVFPAESAPIVFELDGEKVPVIDIGAGGLSFKNKNLGNGDSLSIEFLLPGQNISITAVLTVKAIDSSRICHCEFKDIGADEVEAIHQYVLKRQKEVIQSKRAQKNK
jgi:hypothetical protein